MANHNRGNDQPPHKQFISWFSVQPERLKSTKKTYSNKLFSQTCLLMINPKTTMGPRQAQDNHEPAPAAPQTCPGRS